MSYVDPGDVNAWFESSKLAIQEVDAKIELLAATTIVGRLSSAFDTALWTDEASTPALVVQLIAMKIAATYYRRAYSEDLEGDGIGLNWAAWLEQSVEGYITMILDGTLALDGETSTGVGFPAFYPDDDTTPMFSVSDTF